MELTGDEKLYIELDNGKKVSCQNCFVDIFADDRIDVSRKISDKVYMTTYYKKHIIYYTMALDIDHFNAEHGVDTNEE